MKSRNRILVGLKMSMVAVAWPTFSQVSVEVGMVRLGWHWKPGNEQGIEWVHYYEATLTFNQVPANDMSEYTFH